MEIQENSKSSDSGNGASLSGRIKTLLKELYPLSGKTALDLILNQDNPRELIQDMPQEDFFWLIKKVGDNDCIPLLELAAEKQWEYLLDLETWKKDRINLEQTSHWFVRLGEAAPGRLAAWLHGKARPLSSFYFFNSVEVMVKGEEEDFLPGEGFITFDDVVYVRVLDEKNREDIENILKIMAAEDLQGYQDMLAGLGDFIPAETEEEMYRMRNVRLAEHGFLPYEEALSVYTPLDAETLSLEEPGMTGRVLVDEGMHSLVPVLPLYHAGSRNLFSVVFSKIPDSLLLERIRFEFGGLCNRILSADGMVLDDAEILIKTCKKAAGYVNLALEKLCGSDTELAGRFLGVHSLESFFRAGFGMVLQLKWEVEAWVEESWFYGRELGVSFWGDEWGGTLTGLIEARPRYYVGLKNGEEYRHFETLTEWAGCLDLIRKVKLLDRLLAKLTETYLLKEDIPEIPDLNFRPFLFNLWARKILDLTPCFSGITQAQAGEFFGRIRAGEKKPPFLMSQYKESFVRYFLLFSSTLEEEDAAILEETLSRVWQEFIEEYQSVSLDDIDRKVTKFLFITP